MIKIHKKKHGKNKIIAIAGGALAVVVISYLGVALKYHYPPFVQAKGNNPAGQYVNLERSDAEKQKSQELVDNPQAKTQNDQTDVPTPPSATSSGKQSVNVLLTNASVTNNTVKASGLVTNLVQEGGSCTYTFTNGSTVITKTSNTLTNPTSTTCESVSFSADELTAGGAWKVVLKYASSSAEGVSNTKEFTK
ncbi:MAG TPA: hypothetical protein VLG36_03245 [Candidatus Chromulinivoraceae bacterium]|nr:hypothetical protein [Candidatus Chromulinivoraceae bacterium]